MYIPADFSEIKSQEQVKRALEMKVAAYFAELKPENIITIVNLLNSYFI